MHSYSFGAQDTSFNPGWNIGDSWEVEVLQRANYMSETNPPWLAPLHWRFEVLAVEPAEEMLDELEKAIRMHIKMEEAPLTPSETKTVPTDPEEVAKALEMQDKAEKAQGMPVEEDSSTIRECFKIAVTNLDNPSKAPSLLLYYDTTDFHLVRGEIYSKNYNGKTRLSKGDDFPLIPFNVPQFSTLTEEKSEKAFCKALNREVDAVSVEVEGKTYSGAKSKQQWSKSAPWWISYERGNLIKATLTSCSRCK